MYRGKGEEVSSNRLSPYLSRATLPPSVCRWVIYLKKISMKIRAASDRSRARLSLLPYKGKVLSGEESE
jgi:hypothetical protein